MACLSQFVPGLLLDIQILSLPRYSQRRSNLAPINNSNISMQAQTSHTQHHNKQITPSKYQKQPKHHAEHFQAFLITITISMNKAKIYLLTKL
jgi:G3E family GTPase